MKKFASLSAVGVMVALFAGQAMAEGPKGEHGKRHGQMFEETDTNKDGIVTREEFHAQGDKLFAKLDTNGDGKITKAERDAKHAEMKEKWAAKRAEGKTKREAAGGVAE